ncbi:DNA polymerase III subunit gamma/tau [Microbacterium memoriense]|uniref:DNA polymerase III subunit gamma/tau n=1 Tax=Microbacterium memoriense TaxID=2978350 RepID=A0ABT2PA94_9MICO|nr:DNA polymerase III subunit gamma/tau [Microbacterium memoriense]MCT9001501.1 DNA polymerase III subunit gamma/tau [Microbacterium memoriense]
MSTGRDDDPLSWGGDDDPTLEVGTPVAAPTLPAGFTAVGRGSDDVARIAQAGTATPVAGPVPLSNAMLVTIGVIGGIYALYVVGWFIGGVRLQGTANFLVSPVGYGAALWLAVAAPILWFVTAFVLTRTSKSWVRIGWLVAGLALLLPWPFILVGAVGAVA